MAKLKYVYVDECGFEIDINGFKFTTDEQIKMSYLVSHLKNKETEENDLVFVKGIVCSKEKNIWVKGVMTDETWFAKFLNVYVDRKGKEMLLGSFKIASENQDYVLEGEEVDIDSVYFQNGSFEAKKDNEVVTRHYGVVYCKPKNSGEKPKTKKKL